MNHCGTDTGSKEKETEGGDLKKKRRCEVVKRDAGTYRSESGSNQVGREQIPEKKQKKPQNSRFKRSELSALVHVG